MSVRDVPQDFSSEYKRKIDHIISEEKKPYYPLIKTTFRKVICLIAAVLLMDSMTVAAVPELREWFIGLFITQNEDSAEAKFANGVISGQRINVDENIMSPTLIPDGYDVTDEITDEFTHNITYSNDTKQIEFSQTSISLGIHIDTEKAETTKIKINNFDGYLSVTKDSTILVWFDEIFSYSITGNISKSDIISMADSVKINKVSK